MDASQANSTRELLSLLTAGRVDAEQLPALFAPVLAESREVIYSFDHRANRFLFLTPNAPALFGLSEEELARADADALNTHIHPADFARVMEQWGTLEEETRQSPQTAAGRMRYRWRKGQRYVWLEQSFRFLLDEQGVKHVEIGIVRDFTQEHVKTQRLQQSQRILESIDEAVILLDQDRRILWVNRTAADAAGLEPVECVGRICRELWDNSACEQCRFEEVLATGKPASCEVSLPDGTRWHIWFYPTPGLDGQGGCITEIARNITAEYTARAEMRLTQERFAEAISAAGHVLYRYNPATDRFDYISASCDEILGFSQEVLMGFSWQDNVNRVHPKDWPGVEAIIAEARERHSPCEPQPFSAEYRWKKKDGSWLWVSLSATMRFDADDELVAIIGSAHDITDRKQAEQMLHRTQQYFDEALETTRHLLYRYDIQAERFDYVSPYAEILFGKSLDEIQYIGHLEKFTFRPRWSFRSLAASQKTAEYEPICTIFCSLPESENPTRYPNLNFSKYPIDYPQMLKEIHPDDRQRVEEVMLDGRQPHAPNSKAHSQIEYRRLHGRSGHYIWMRHYRTVVVRQQRLARRGARLGLRYHGKQSGTAGTTAGARPARTTRRRADRRASSGLSQAARCPRGRASSHRRGAARLRRPADRRPADAHSADGFADRQCRPRRCVPPGRSGRHRRNPARQCGAVSLGSGGVRPATCAACPDQTVSPGWAEYPV